MDSQHSAVVKVAVRADARVGEGPVWRAETSSLLWVDIPRGEVHESVLPSGTTTTRRIPESLGAVALTGSDELLLACRSGFATLRDDQFVPLAPFLGEAERMNDAKCDPAGRFWAGSTAIDFTPGQGALHVLEADGARRVAVDGLTCPTGWTGAPLVTCSTSPIPTATKSVPGTTTSPTARSGTGACSPRSMRATGCPTA